MIFYDYLLTPQLFSYTAISRRNTVSCIKYQYRAALMLTVNYSILAECYIWPSVPKLFAALQHT